MHHASTRRCASWREIPKGDWWTISTSCAASGPATSSTPPRPPPPRRSASERRSLRWRWRRWGGTSARQMHGGVGRDDPSPFTTTAAVHGDGGTSPGRQSRPDQPQPMAWRFGTLGPCIEEIGETTRSGRVRPEPAGGLRREERHQRPGPGAAGLECARGWTRPVRRVPRFGHRP